MRNALFSTLQKVGQSLMMPVSVLPAAGLLVAIGRLFKDAHMSRAVQILGEVMYSGGLAVFEQLPMVFAVGVAIGFTGGAGAAGLAAVVGYLTMANVLKVIGDAQKLEMAINVGVFGGIVVGLMTAALYNRFHQIKLHPIFGFFSGKRFVPIVTALCAFGLALILGAIWPPLQLGIYNFGQSVLNSDLGPAFYAAGKRLLIPVGLHHVYYPPFLFQFGDFLASSGQMVHGESARYFAGDPTAGRFMASEFPIMLFGLPAATLAMFLAAPANRRKSVAGVMLSAALTSIITGITEPIEFAFIFVAPLLYVLHVALAFASGYFTNLFDIHLGYTFSASVIDMFLGWFNQKNTIYLLAVVGPCIAAVYFVSFYTLIRVFGFETPGREKENSDALEAGSNVVSSVSERARQVLAALGGAENLIAVDACITRLRVTTKDPAVVKKEEFKRLGASGVMQAGSNFQIIFGFESEAIKDQIKSILKKTYVCSPIPGRILPLTDVPDETFARKILGDGFAVWPSEGVVYSPVDAEVATVFPTGHALGLVGLNGLEFLIHVGIDTVQMKGEGFKSLVKAGDKVKAGQKLIEFDLDLIGRHGKSLATPVLITNMDHVKSLTIDPNGSMTSPVMSIEL